MKFLRSCQSKLLVLIFILLGGVILQHNAVAQRSTPLAEIELETYPVDAAWNYDGTLLAIATVDSVIIYDLQLTELARFEPHTEDIRSINWHPSQNRLLTVGDATIKIWDFDATLQTISFETTLTESNADYPLVAAWSPDGNKLAEIWIDHHLTFADDPGTILMRNPTTWELEQQELGPKYIYNPYPLLFWSPDSTHFTVTGRVNSSSSYYVVLDASTLTFGYSHDINTTRALVWKNYLAVFEGIAGIDLNYTTPEYLFSDLDFPGGTYALDLNPNADKIIRAGNDNIDIIDVATLTVLVTFQPTAFTDIVRWNPTTDIFVSAGITNDSQHGWVGHITIWDVSSLPDTSGTPTITPFQSPTPYVTATPITPTATPLPRSIGKIIFTMNNQLYTINPDGTGLTQLTGTTPKNALTPTPISHCEPAWSPNGKSVVYVSPCYNPAENMAEGSQIYVRKYSVISEQLIGKATPIAVSTAANYNPAWSPDSRSVVFTSQRREYATPPIGNPDLYMTSANGTTLDDPIHLIFNVSDDNSPDWSVNNDVVFISDRNRQDQIYWANADIGYALELPIQYKNVASPSWSPDGTKFAFAVGVVKRTILIYDITTSETEVINVGDLDVQELDWSPFSNQIVFTAKSETIIEDQLFLIDLDTAGIRQLTSTSGKKSQPSWAYDTVPVYLPTPTPPPPTAPPLMPNKIVFTKLVNDQHDIFIMNPDGSGETNFTNTAYDELYPVWSPDGTRLAYSVAKNVNEYHIYVRDLATGIETQITPSTTEYFEIQPAWSPDGNYVAYRSSSRKIADVDIRLVGGYLDINLTQTRMDPERIWDWSADNRLLYSSMYKGLTWIDVTSGEMKEIVIVKTCQYARWSSDGTRIACIEHDNQIQLYDNTGTPLDTYTPYPDQTLISLAWSPDNHTLLVSSHDYVFNFDLKTEQSNIIATQDPSNLRESFDWSPN